MVPVQMPDYSLNWASGGCICLPSTRQDLTQDHRPEGQIIVEIRGGEGQVQVETRALQVYAGHQPT